MLSQFKFILFFLLFCPKISYHHQRFQVDLSLFLTFFFSSFYYSFGFWHSLNFWQWSLNLLAIFLNLSPQGPFIILAKKFNPLFNPGISNLFPLISTDYWSSSITAISFIGFWWTYLILRRGCSCSIFFSQLSQRS